MERACDVHDDVVVEFVAAAAVAVAESLLV